MSTDGKSRTVTFSVSDSDSSTTHNSNPNPTAHERSVDGASNSPRESPVKVSEPAGDAAAVSESSHDAQADAPSPPQRDTPEKNVETIDDPVASSNGAPVVKRTSEDSHASPDNASSTAAAPSTGPKSILKSSTKDRISARKRAKYVLCHDCGKEIPIEEWPDHRDRLRSVEIVKTRVSRLQRYAVRLFIDFFMWVLMNVYFREVAVAGLENIPKHGAVVFYGNHQNQFIDALLVRAICSRPVRFIMAEKSFHVPVAGWFGKMMDAVPVVRPQDVPLSVGQGKLVRVEGNMIYGSGTRFTVFLNNGDVVSWPKVGGKGNSSGQVRHVLSDTQLELTQPVTPENVFTDATTFRYSQRIDHSLMYAKVYQTLQQGHCIGIFPEGGSHDRTSLLPLKAGVALFSLGAAERDIDVTIVPCGLTYFYGHKFRSRAHVEFGEPMTPSDALVSLFSNNKREATGILLKQLDESLRSITINVPDWNALKFLHAFRQLYQPENCVLSSRDYLRLMRRLNVIMASQKDSAEFIEFRTKVENYTDYCNALLVRDSQAATLRKLDDLETTPALQLLFRRTFTLFVMGVILAPFFVVCLPIGFVTQWIAGKQAKQAKVESKVKVVGADVKGSLMIKFGFAFVPLQFSLVSFIVFLFTDLRTSLTVFFSLPMAMYVSLLILQEAVMELRAALPLFMSMISKHKQFRKLYERRLALVTQTKEIVQRLDPQLEEELEAYVKESDPVTAQREPSLFSLRHNNRRRFADNTP